MSKKPPVKRTTLTMEKKPLSEEDLQIPENLSATLKAMEGPGPKDTFPIFGSSTVVGRGELADLLIQDPAMSRRHFVISYRNLEFRIQDLDSSNGTYLNGSEVQEYALRNGDEIVAGDTRFVFSVGRAKPAKG